MNKNPRKRRSRAIRKSIGYQTYPESGEKECANKLRRFKKSQTLQSRGGWRKNPATLPEPKAMLSRRQARFLKLTV